MVQKDPVCGMMIDERKAQHISEVNGQKVYLCSAAVRVSLIKILTNMELNNNNNIYNSLTVM